MQYESFDEWFNSNTKGVKDIANRLCDAEKEEINIVLDWLKSEIAIRDKMLNLLDCAMDDIIDPDVKHKITSCYMMRLYNDIVMNTEVGQDMLAKGLIKPQGITMIYRVK